jgi:hypothetical protein
MQRVSGIHLSDFDRKALALAAATYVAATKDPNGFRSRRTQALTAGSLWLEQTLTPDGQKALDTYLELSKASIKILP